MFTLEFSTDNADFDDDPKATVVRILREIAELVQGGAQGGPIRDINGNSIGRFNYNPFAE